MHDVEPAVRLNAALEADSVQTEVVSPMDDLPGTAARVKPDVMVVTGALLDTTVESVVRSQLWRGTSTIGLADSADDRQRDRARIAGYVEVLAKPVPVDELVAVVKHALDRRRLQEETGLIGESSALREVLVKIEQMAPVSSTVLIEGESGSGKELVARALHRLSSRRNKPFIAVNVGALPETLLESELFGHEKGAFTGAAERRIGRFELADTGTLFLDEIGEVPLATQVKLLRALEEREFQRLGGTQDISVDVRVIAATNRPLREQMEQGTFRSDLFYRLNVLSIYLPPLRERPEDVPHLVRRFIEEYSRQHDRPFHGVSQPSMQLLMDYSWPGNVRELRNLVESMVVLSPGREIMPEDLPSQIHAGGAGRFLPVHVGAARGQAAAGEGREVEFILRSILELRLQVEELRRKFDETMAGVSDGAFIGEVLPSGVRGGEAGTGIGADGGGIPARRIAGGISPRDVAPAPNVVVVEPGTRMADVERRVIAAALKETRGNRRRAAAMLGIGERTLYRKIKEYRLPEDGYLEA